MTTPILNDDTDPDAASTGEKSHLELPNFHESRATR